MRCCALCLVSGLLSVALAAPSSTYAQSGSSTPSAAHVYVQAKSGVYVFNANAAGKLTKVSGSPFPDAGEMEAVRSNALISVGTTWLHSYAIGANGAVGHQLAEVDTANYRGAECGTTDNSGSVMDHTGQYFSVQLYGALTDDGNNYLCDAWQTYKVETNGEFTFVGAWVGSQTSDDYAYENSPLELNLITVSSNNKYVYGWVGDPDGIYFVPFTRAESGEIMLNQDFTETDPTPQPGSEPYPNPDSADYFPQGVAADSSGHLAALVVGNETAYVASYSINASNGSIASTNSWKNMPTTDHNYPLAMSPAGNLVALASTDQYPDGVALFHFNGAAPPTYFTTFLPNVQIDLMAWDKSNHLYMLSYETDQIYVYTVTPTSVKAVAGSPYAVPGAAKGAWEETGFVVVPQ